MIYVHHHLGLGDHIVCNGLVRHIMQTTREPIMLAVKKHNYSCVKHLYEGTSVLLDAVLSDKEAQAHYEDASSVRRIGFEHCTADWERSFYDQLDLDYAQRYNGFSIERNCYHEGKLLQKLNISGEFAFCNIKSSTGSYDLSIDTALPKVYLEPLTDSIFDWIGVLEKASEVHTIDSSVFQLIKQLNLECRKVFYDTRGEDSTRTAYTFENDTWEVRK